MCHQEPIEKIEYEMVTLEIWPDDFHSDPRRDFDNLGHMICWHRRYNLGDDHKFSDVEDLWRSIAYEAKPGLEERIDQLENPDIELTLEEWNERDKWVEERVRQLVTTAVHENAVILPLYLYDHSGISMSTSRHWPFDCPWDSGQVGYIYVTHEEIRKEFGWKRLTKARLEKIADNLVSEVKVYDMALTGQIYYYDIVDNNGEEVDSCGGFYGFDYIMQEAQGTAARWNVLLYCEAQRSRVEEERQSRLDEQNKARKQRVLTELQLAVI